MEDVRLPEWVVASQCGELSVSETGSSKRVIAPCCGLGLVSVAKPLEESTLSTDGHARHCLRDAAGEPSIIAARKDFIDVGSRDVSLVPEDEVGQHVMTWEDKASETPGHKLRRLMVQIFQLQENEVVKLCKMIFLSFPEVERQLIMNQLSQEQVVPSPPHIGSVTEDEHVHHGCSPEAAQSKESQKALDADILRSESAKGETQNAKICLEMEANIYGEDVDVQRKLSAVNTSMCCASNQRKMTDAEALQAMIVSRDFKGVKVGKTSLPIIQFIAADVYVREDEKVVKLDVMRIGDIESISKVCWETRDGTALSGLKYIGGSGELVFKEGQRIVSITINLVDDSKWDATLNFFVALLNNTCQKARVSIPQSICNVRILEDETFPSNFCKGKLMEGEDGQISAPRLLLVYFKMNMKNPVVNLGVWKSMVVDLFSNLVFVYGLFIELYILEVVLCNGCIGQDDQGDVDSGSFASMNFISSRDLLWIVAMIRFAPHPLSLYLDNRKVHFKVAGASRKTLQANLLRKFLSFTAKSRELVCESYFFMAITRDVSDLVEGGFCKSVAVVKNCTRIVLVLLFHVCRNRLIGQASSESPWDIFNRILPALLMPIFFACFLKFRNVTTIRHLEEQQSAGNVLLEKARYVVAHHDLVRVYGKTGELEAEFDDVINNFNKCFVDCGAVVVKNKSFSPLMTLLLVSFYTVYGGIWVFEGLSLGKFVSTMQVYTAIGVMMGDVYENFLDMQNALDALRTIVMYMNLPLDLDERLELSRVNRAFVMENLQSPLRPSCSRLWSYDVDPADLLSIELRNVCFRYRGSGNLTCNLKNVCATMPQGGFYALVGPPSEGKGTILKMICGAIMPGLVDVDSAFHMEGQVLVPTHLRVLNVVSNPIFIKATLLTNLLLGVMSGTNDGVMERVVDICRMLGLSEASLQLLEQNTCVCDWMKTLSATEASLLHVARALVANPEVLCIHKPTLYLQADMGANLYNVLKTFVLERGIKQDPAQFHTRRPRTCIVTSRSTIIAEMVDAAFHVSKAHGIKRLQRAEGGGWTVSSQSVPSRVSSVG
eukprot:TRINITY_DN1257_c0_g2_i1.p1 TRINITY_DN1257_c0_g2~~TRINITY_DN1257_c0_g2_i1.p1  ORF type:complete len:1084 (-),score=157.43 TRINITY_DN1257_c0_g2_i1:12-3185(-)